MYGAYQRAASGGRGDDTSGYSAYESDRVELHKTDVRMGAASQSRAKLICAGFCLFAVGLIIGVLSGKPRCETGILRRHMALRCAQCGNFFIITQSIGYTRYCEV